VWNTIYECIYFFFIYTTTYCYIICWHDIFQPKTIRSSSCHMLIEQMH
jgi:hypothetical protein